MDESRRGFLKKLAIATAATPALAALTSEEKKEAVWAKIKGRHARVYVYGEDAEELADKVGELIEKKDAK